MSLMTSDRDIENLLRLLPRWKPGILLRYGVSSAIVVVFCLIRLGLPIQGVPYLLFIPPVFLASVLFDHGSGFFATVLSAILATYFFIEPRYSMIIPVAQLPGLVIFVATCCGIAILSEALRTALERAVDAERGKALLYSELNHRLKNNLAVIITLLRLQSRRLTEETARAPFEQAIERIRVLAATHDHLNRRHASLRMQGYLDELSRHLGDAHRGLRPIAIRVDADDVEVGPDLASALGLIANELITNALKHDFPGERAGNIAVTLRRKGAELVMEVSDDGVGARSDATDGLGSKLVMLLSQQYGGSSERLAASTGCVTRVRLPLPHETP